MVTFLALTALSTRVSLLSQNFKCEMAAPVLYLLSKYGSELTGVIKSAPILGILDICMYRKYRHMNRNSNIQYINTNSYISCLKVNIRASHT
jgi:hypothetical protein